MPRLPPLLPENMTEAQRRIAAGIAASRGIATAAPRGPFAVWLRSPELADRAQALGEFARYHTSLAPRLSELAILVTARAWDAAYEWKMHEAHARAAGLDDAIIAAVRRAERPAAMQSDEAAVHDLARELHATRRVGETTYQAALAALGEAGTVELVGIVGYYTVIAMTLNVFEVAAPDGSIWLD
jgi:4-carboxymuconolactone decarboxylase